jgi:DNA-binding MarR family transcriptional regulator
MTEEGEVNVLDIDHVFSILQYLDSRKGEDILASELRAVMPNYGRMMLIVRQLEKKSLIEIRMETRPRKRYLLSLTDRGRTVIRKLLALDRLISSWQ